MTELVETLESMIIKLAKSQETIINKLPLENTKESIDLLEKAGNNLREIMFAYEKISADKDLLTAEQVIKMNFFPQGTLSIDKLYRLGRKGKIPTIRLDGRVFFSRRALYEFVQEQCRNSMGNIDDIKATKKIQNKEAASIYQTKITAIPE